MTENYALRNLRPCKDCLCLYVCPLASLILKQRYRQR